jgi:CheY-like chemotaxis protein
MNDNNRKTILLVEDNEDNLVVYRTILEHVGYRVVEARDGEEGVSRAHEQMPDLILMDISIPKIDGWEATQRLKGDEKPLAPSPSSPSPPTPSRRTGRRPSRPAVTATSPSPSSRAASCRKSSASSAQRSRVAARRLFSAIHTVPDSGRPSDRRGETWRTMRKAG